MKNFQRVIWLLCGLLAGPLAMYGQEEEAELTDLDRTFMPAIQMGYVFHGTPELSGGIMVQTSIEYRDISNFTFRVNYDDFNSNMNVEYPVNQDLQFTGRVSFTEFIGGVGYRQQMGKHNLTGYVQSGIRTYGYPVFNIDSTQANLDYDSRNIPIMRYSLGYEFALAPRLFLTVEALVSHTLNPKDYWIDDRWSYGVTVGISAPLI
ncbi:hypothetical protein [Pontibacter sp. G13]|uniref:hypothetical protein n=1 Tax=Pontibacter sp. G13 TaxID=3074898 RepID=UPI00288AA248|nr:hypothetical protein [Pontibacter sp. G13]WNJ17083.1 hypothetical protein RJD25_19690 [Pontibacter sp. G13]